MKKFPVYGEDGKEYMVKLELVWYSTTHYEVLIFEKGKKFLGVQLYRQLNSRSVFDTNIPKSRVFDEEEWEYDYIKIAKQAIKDYVEEEAIRLSLIEKKMKEFKRWDGR